MLGREGPVAGIDGRHVAGPLNEEGLGAHLQAGVPHQLLIGLPQEEGGLCVVDVVADRQVDGRRTISLQAVQDQPAAACH